MSISRLPSSTQPLKSTRPLSSTQPLAPSSEPPPAERKASPAAPESQASAMTLLDASPQLQSRPDFQRLFASGKLSASTLQQLDRLAVQPLAVGIDREELLGAAIAQIEDPGAITQGSKQTCAAAVVQAKLAEDDPAEYLRLVCELASPEGRGRFADGEEVRRQDDALRGNGRSIIDNLIQPAFMAFATGGQYDALSDQRRTLKGTGQGLYADEQTKLLNAVSREKNTAVFGNDPKVLATMQQALKAGHSVPAIYTFTDPKTGALQGHSVLIEQIQGGKVTFLDPHAGRQTVSLQEFQTRLQSVNLPTSLLTPELKSRRAASDGGVLAGFSWGSLAEGICNAGKAVVDGVSATVSAVMKATGSLCGFVEQHADVIRTAIQVTCMFVPGLQVISLGLALLDLYDGGKELVEGMRKGDWKRGLAGAGGMLKAIGSGLGGAGAKLLGDGIKTLAFGFKSAALVCQAGVELSDGIRQANPSRLLRGTAHLFGGVTGVIGESCQKTYEKLILIVDKLGTYSEEGQAVFNALLNRDPQGLVTALGMVASISRDHANGIDSALDPDAATEKGRALSNVFREGGQAMKVALELGQTLSHPSQPAKLAAAASALKLGAQANRVWHNRDDFELVSATEKAKETTGGTMRAAEYTETLSQMLGGQFGQGAFELIKKATHDLDHHWEETPYFNAIEGIEKALPGKTPSRRPSKEEKK